jgi:hypothetical protein
MKTSFENSFVLCIVELDVMKKLLLLLLLVPMVTFGQDDLNINISSENTTANKAGAFNSARMKEWTNMRDRRLQKYTYNPSKKTATKLYRANKVIGLPLDAGISPIHMKKWLPKINLAKKVVIKKKLTKDDAIKEVKDLKDLLNLGIITQEEFDKKAAELKKVILGN